MVNILQGKPPTDLGYGYYGYGYGYGDGNGYGYGGYGNGDGNGYGNGDGNGYGYGGYGYGDGNGYGAASETYWSKTIEAIFATLSPEQKKRVSDLKKLGVIFAYWRSTKNGEPANGGNGTKAKVGLVEEISGPLEICTRKALHGTLNPPKWNGPKIWVVAMYPPFEKQDDKIGSLKREIICEANFYIGDKRIGQ